MKGVISSSFYLLFKYTRDHCRSAAVCVVLLCMMSAPIFLSKVIFGRTFYQLLIALKD